MKFKTEKIRYLVEAEKYGLCTSNLRVLGESIKYTIVKFKPPSVEEKVGQFI